MRLLADPYRPAEVVPTESELERLLTSDWQQRGGIWILIRRSLWGILLVGVLGISGWQAEVSLEELAEGLPRLWDWAHRLWPPDLSELPTFLVATWETLAIAILGTGVAAFLALPMSWFLARNVSPMPTLAWGLRGITNVLRGIDTAIFALFFVSVVGLGPFAGVLGVLFHTTGSMAKLYAEVLEGLPAAAIEAVEVTGAGRLRTFAFAVLPEALPGLLGVTLYLWEFNVRSSVILGIVGAGGIGYELLVSLKLLDFGRLTTILLLILMMISVIDLASARLRQCLR